MAVTLIINGQSTEADAALSLFDQAEAMGIDVPTSCRKQGKCKECMVEIVEGMDALSPMTEAERHLKGNFRLSCQTFCRSAARLNWTASAATPCAVDTWSSSARHMDCLPAVRSSRSIPPSRAMATAF